MIVGCPIYKRAWCLPRWYKHVLAAATEACLLDLGFIFVVDPQDKETISCIRQTIKMPTHIVEFALDHSDDTHAWTHDRYHEMALLRNKLLEEVRKEDPELFFSLDSDILLHPKTIANLMENIHSFDAVGGKCYMMEVGTEAPSYAMLGGAQNLIRPDAFGVIPVDAIMAIKLMTKKAYQIDYEYHDRGEDVGWSLACKREGLTLGWDGRVTNKHVMNRDKLDIVDERCGF